MNSCAMSGVLGPEPADDGTQSAISGAEEQED